MKKWLLVFLFPWLVLSARAGDGVGSGGGVLEAMFTYAYTSMPMFLREALVARQEIRLDDAQVLAVQKILNNFSAELPAKYALKFEPDPKEFSWHEECNALKLAYTKPTKAPQGDPIYLNQSVFYKLSAAKSFEPVFGFSVVVQILVHELGHHNGYEDHHWLEDIGAKVAIAAAAYVKRQSEVMDKFLAQKEEVGRDRPKLTDLGKYKNMPRVQKAGMVFPHVEDVDGHEAALYFVPYGESSLFRLFTPLEETSRLGFAIGGDNGKVTWFSGQIEVVAEGRMMRDAMGIYLDDKAKPVNSYMFVNGIPSPENFAPLHMLQGRINEYQGWLYITYFTAEKDADGRNIKANKHDVYLKFIEPAFERNLKHILRTEGPPFAIVFTIDTYDEVTHKPSPVRAATYVLQRAHRPLR